MSQQSDKVTFRISSAAAPYVGADKPRQERLKAAAGQVALPPNDLVLLVYYLCHDPDPEVKRTALETLRGFDVAFLSQLLSNPQLHPRILDVLAKLHFEKAELAPLFAAHPMLSEKAAAFLAERGAFADLPEPADAPEGAPEGALAEGSEGAVADAPEEGPEDDAPVDEEDEKFQSKYQMAQGMRIADKIKMAFTGDKEWRTILIRDANKLVSGAVVKNPRMTEGEVLAIAKSTVQNDEIMRVICANREWVKNPLIRKALAENNKTPLPAALRFVAMLSEKDLSLLAKSKNVSAVIVSQARRILMTKKNGR
ncbi:MAG TPA: hypothetical protein VIK40_11370 [Geomonas sp.]